MSLKTNRKRNLLLTSTAAFAMANMMYAPMANAIVPNDDNEGEAAIDTDGGVNGVGMFFSSEFGVCTGTLINPRTVLFAAHCVNSRPETDWGTDVAASFSFNVDNLDAVRDWFFGGFGTNTNLNIFNVSQIQYHPDSLLNPQARGFLEADIALATLDTPAAQIPTWALLFSALPVPGQLDNVTGTGYHVDITGYGRSGNGTLGDVQGIDFRRRAAENMLGALASIDDRNNSLFGPGAPNLPQNVYWTDFDDPASADGRDLNLFLDEPLEREGTTAGGDSGGPLILDAANNDITDIDIQIGVLSGGGGFFGNNSAYGEFSIYQPLYLFADYIAATNPYRYVSAQAGDGNWEDASHWQTDTDPNYFVFDDSGSLVNGFPAEQPDGINGTEGDFGGVCVDFHPRDTPRSTNCIDLSTGNFVEQPAPDGNGAAATNVSNNVGQVDLDALRSGEVIGNGGNNTTTLDGALPSIDANFQLSNSSQPSTSVTAEGPLPAPTIDNGLAGATDFVPDNIDPNAAANTRGRYYDVTLSADGTTTLSSAVEIDRLTINGAGARLDVAAAGSLTSLIDIEQRSGWVDVNGQITSVGDYLLMSGMLTGNGTITTPFLTNVMGGIAPGGLGSVGTLTIDGSAVLSSGSGLMIDIGANGVNDVLAITGDASLGGNVVFAPTADVRAGNTYEFVTIAGTQSGAFNDPAAISPLLSAVLSYEENSVIATIEAGSYSDAIDGSNAVQQSYANLLDGGRGAASLAPIFATLDLSSTETIQSVLDSWAPVAETTVRSLAKTTTEQVKRFHRDRMDAMASGSWGGKLTMMGAPVQMASNAQYASIMSDIGHLQANNGETIHTTANIPSDYEVYLSGAFIDGKGSAMPTEQNFADEDFDGFAINGGIEKLVSEKVSVGASVSYTSLDAEASLNQVAETEHLAGTLYGQIRSASNVMLDGQLSYGSFSSATARNVAFPSNATLTTDDDSKTFGGELRLSKSYKLGEAQIVPRASLTYTSIDFEKVSEAGGLPGLTVNRNDITSTQGRVGLAIKSAPSATVRLTTHADYVTELGELDDSFEANFVGLTSPTSSFALFGTDESWGEIGAGLAFDMKEVTINISADTTVARKDIEARTVRAGMSVKF